MSRGSGSSFILLAVFLATFLIVLPVSAGNVTPNTTTIATLQTTVATTNTTVVTSPATATPTETTIAVTLQTTIIPTEIPTIFVEETETTGSMMIFSSPSGASILIDGVYSGETPKTMSGMSAGNHILRLELSRYYDYEGSIYVIPGQTAQGYGTLQPMNQDTLAAPTESLPVIVPVVTATPVPTQDPGLLGSSNVVIAIIGALIVMIAAGVSIFFHLRPSRKE